MCATTRNCPAIPEHWDLMRLAYSWPAALLRIANGCGVPASNVSSLIVLVDRLDRLRDQSTAEYRQKDRT
jgi:hypothetical protein